MRWGLAIIAALVAVSAAAALWPAQPGGARWDEAGGDGHSRLADALSEDSTVRVVESSLSLLPPDAGPDDTLFVFLTAREPTDGEAHRVARFVQDGGTLVLAADGTGGGRLLASLGMSLHGIPAMRAEGEGCVTVRIPVGEGTFAACLPSPSAYPETSLERAPVNLTFAARSEQRLLFDLDADGRLALEDQAPGHLPVALSWQHGSGQVVAIAESDLWRNRVILDMPSNTALALALADGAGTVYLDGMGGQETQAQRLEADWLRVLGEDGPGAWPAATVLAAGAVLAGVLPRLPVWRPHRVHGGEADPRIREPAEQMLRESVRGHKATSTDDPTKR